MTSPDGEWLAYAPERSGGENARWILSQEAMSKGEPVNPVVGFMHQRRDELRVHVIVRRAHPRVPVSR